MGKNKLTFTNKFGFVMMLLSVISGIIIFMTSGNTMEVFYVVPNLLIGVILYEKK